MTYAIIERDVDFQTRYGTTTLSGMRIDNYIDQIPPEFLRRKSSEVWKVVCNGITTLENIKGILTHLRELEILEFRNISLDEYEPHWSGSGGVAYEGIAPGSDCTIEANGLLLVKFTRSDTYIGSLSKSETLILDFLTHNVQIPGITCFEMTTGHRPRSGWDQDVLHVDQGNEVMLMMPKVHLPQALTMFLRKIAGTVSDIKFDRNSMDLLVYPPISKEFLFSQIQLKNLHFQTDTFGIGDLLRVQERLHNLTCDEFRGVELEVRPVESPHQVHPRLLNYTLCHDIGVCLLNCSSTLLSLKLEGLYPVMPDSDRILDLPQEEPRPVYYKPHVNPWKFGFKLRSFTNLIQLRTLRIDLLTLSSSTFYMENGDFTLPPLLTSLVIKVSYIEVKELNCLSERVREDLGNLRQLTITADTPFLVGKMCLQNLMKGSGSSSLRDIELENAKFSPEFPSSELQRLLLTDMDGGGEGQRRSSTRYWACEIRPKGLYFERYVTHVD